MLTPSLSRKITIASMQTLRREARRLDRALRAARIKKVNTRNIKHRETVLAALLVEINKRKGASHETETETE